MTNLLPPSAAAKLNALRDELAEISGTAQLARDREVRAYNLLVEAEKKQAADPNRSQPFRPTILERVQNALTLVDRSGNGAEPAAPSDTPEAASLRAEHARLKQIADEKGAAVGAFGNLIVNAETFIRRLSAPVSAVRPAASPRSHGKLDLDKIRGRIANLKAEIAEIENAPLPTGEAKQIITAAIDEMALLGKPRISGVLDGYTTEVVWPHQQAGQSLMDPNLLAVALVCWVNRDALVRRCGEEIDRMAADRPGGLRDAQRASKRSETKAALLSAEREEEQIIVAAAEEDVRYFRRPDADVRAVLGVE